VLVRALEQDTAATRCAAVLAAKKKADLAAGAHPAVALTAVLASTPGPPPSLPGL